MSDLNTRATVTLSVNGQQAEKTLQLLKQNALSIPMTSRMGPWGNSKLPVHS